MGEKSPVQFMMESDAYSQWLGVELEQVEDGFVRLQMRIRKEMVNGFSIAHGGVLFAMADSAMAFAANTKGKLAMVTDAQIQFARPAQLGQTLIVEAKEISRTRQRGIYQVDIWEAQSGKQVARLQGGALISDACIPPDTKTPKESE